ncbi:MFS transporter [Flaviflagellibacter deserti]|uniref:MFS transporter n=1 Tax=Flaviflagellibacter deserti TaxID=2267266 RepID=A0ABV9Z3F1_9HYPH
MSEVVAAPAKASERFRLFAVLGGLYLAQSIPSYLIAAALPPILRENGVSRTSIGMISILFLPLVLKFLWAPQIDRIRPVARRHRAGWVFITQSLTVVCLVAMAFVVPTNMPVVLSIGMAISILVSTQDIATDGYAAKYLPPEDRAIGNAIQGGAIAFGVVIGGTMGLVLYEHIGWTPTVLAIAAASLLPLLAALGMREEDGSVDIARGPRPSIRAFWRRPEARQILMVALIYRASEGLVKAMEGPYLVDRGVPLDWIGYISGGGAVTAGLAGSAIAAVLVRTMGNTNVLLLLGGLRTGCFLMFAAHAVGLLTGFGPLFGAAAFQTLIRYMEIVALYSLFMSVSSSEQPGTDFTILACAQLGVYLIGSFVAGAIADALGYPALFGVAAAISAVAVVLTAWTVRTPRVVPPSAQ